MSASAPEPGASAARRWALRQLLSRRGLPLILLSAISSPIGGPASAAATPAALADSAPTWSCAAASSTAPVSQAPLLPAATAASQADDRHGADPAATAGRSSDYRQRLATTAYGHPRLDRWCLWIEPTSGSATAALWENRWRAAVARALAQWQTLLPIELVDDPAAAQVRLWRRRPPLAPGPDGRLRASHGRATLTLQRVRRGAITRLEPAVEVLLSPAQRELAIEATALHELGHAFGLWGHSDDPDDAMAAVPGARPVVKLSRRDRATVMWLYRQPTLFGAPQAP